MTRHIEMILSVTFNIKSTYSTTTFFIISATIFFLTYLLLEKSGGQFILNIFISSSAGLIPYILLHIKLRHIRVNSSYEAEGLLTELINQYKINYFNMIEAIDRTIPNLKKQPHSRKALTRLSLSIKQYQTKEELDEIIQEFNFSMNTSWAMLLSNNIFLSQEYGDNIQESLEDILSDLIDLKGIHEKNKQYNHETFTMIKYLAPGTYLFSIYTMFAFFGFTIDKFIKYQFQNPIGFKYFLLTIIFIIINYFIYFFMKKPKNDF